MEKNDCHYNKDLYKSWQAMKSNAENNSFKHIEIISYKLPVNMKIIGCIASGCGNEKQDCSLRNHLALLIQNNDLLGLEVLVRLKPDPKETINKTDIFKSISVSPKTGKIFLSEVNKAKKHKRANPGFGSHVFEVANINKMKNRTIVIKCECLVITDFLDPILNLNLNNTTWKSHVDRVCNPPLRLSADIL